MGIDGMTIGFTEVQKSILLKDLDKARVKERHGGGNRTYSYLETWDVEDRANQIFGFDGWSSETLELIETWSGKRPTRNGEKAAIAFRARVRITVYAGSRTIIKEAWGYGDGMDNDHGAASELAIKESEADAAKRAFKKFGHQFGLALYDKSQEHVRHGVDDEIEREQTDSQRQDDRPKGEGARRSPPPPPPPPPPVRNENVRAANDAPIDDEPVTKPAPRGGRVSTKPDPGAPKVKTFTAPRLDGSESDAELEEVWRKWGQRIAAAIKSAPDEQNARAMLAANAKSITQCKKDTGNDMTDWAIGLIEKRWPPAETPAQADDAAYDDIAPPESDSSDEWDDWIDLLIEAITKSPDVASGRDVITANAKHFERGDKIVKFSIAEFLTNQLDAKFNVRKSRGR